MKTHSVHFVGFRGDEYNRAALIWGPPDFVHRWHDLRMYGDIGENDTVIFANKERPDHTHKYVWQDHELW